MQLIWPTGCVAAGLVAGKRVLVDQHHVQPGLRQREGARAAGRPRANHKDIAFLRE